ncbi:MFS transporter, partial [Phytoactinopolyspora endophytica]|uniref:MFS transporter n=1 Tax=Phytoactinopolyspora endophytica TaxID=1642495 RepID=UPI00197C04F8
MTSDAGEPTPEPVPSAAIPALQRRTLALLVAAQIVGGLGIGSALAVGSVVALRLSGSERWSGLAGTMITLGAGLLAIPLARLAAARGRRLSLSMGWAIATAGALTTLLAAVISSFLLFLVGLLLFGSGTATNLQSRYAATDLSPDRFRARHLSIVVWSTTVGSVLGPNLTGPGATVGRWLGIPAIAGPFVFSAAGFIAATMLIALLLRPDPLLVAQNLQRDEPASAESAREPGFTQAASPAQAGPTRPAVQATRASAWSTIRHRPAALLSLAAVVVGHGVMVAIMTMTPVHLTHHGSELRIIG